MAQHFDIAIQGGGIVGSTLALHLAANRLRVALQTQPPPAGQPDVRAYALNHSSRRLLQAVRCWPDERHATPVMRMQVHGDQGGAIQFDTAMQGVPALNWIVDIAPLEHQLEQAIAYQPLITRIEHTATADLTVICEGRHSPTRQSLGVPMGAMPYQQHAIATRLRSEHPHQQIAHQWFHQHAGRSAIAGLLPLGGVGASDWALVWSVATEALQPLMDMDDASFCEQLSTVTGHAFGQVSLASPRKSWGLQHACAERWSGQAAWGHWVLAGDAAHHVHPLAGQGLNLGLGDVAELVNQLCSKPYWKPLHDRHILRAYERARKAEFALTGGAGDGLQRLFAHSTPWVQQLRNHGMNWVNASGFIKHFAARHAMGMGLGTTPTAE